MRYFLYLLAVLLALPVFATPVITTATVTVDTVLTLVGTGFGTNTIEIETLDPRNFAAGTSFGAQITEVASAFGEGWHGGVSTDQGSPVCRARVLPVGGFTGNHVLHAPVYNTSHYTNGFFYKPEADGGSDFGSVYVSWYQLMTNPSYIPKCSTSEAECNKDWASAKIFRVNNTNSLGGSSTDEEGEMYFEFDFDPDNGLINNTDLNWYSNSETDWCCIGASECSTADQDSFCQGNAFFVPYNTQWQYMTEENNRDGHGSFAGWDPMFKWIRYEVTMIASTVKGTRNATFRLRTFGPDAEDNKDYFYDADIISHEFDINLSLGGETLAADPWALKWDKVYWMAYWSARGDAIDYYYDDIFISTENGAARIVLGDEPTWGACRTFSDLVPTSWDDTGIAATFKIGGVVKLEPYHPVYVYVVNSTGAVNQNGKAVTSTIVNPPRQFEYPSSPPIEGGGR